MTETPRQPQTSAVRESFVLPLLFLTVVLLGGLRPSGDGAAVRFAPPPLIALILAVLLVGVLVRGHRLAPGRLLGGHRSSLENLNGVFVLVTLFFASAQLFRSVVPESGLANVVFNTLLLILLWNTLAAGPRAGRLLHSLLVLFGSAFVLKYVVLAGLHAPEAGLTRRLLAAVLEGGTFGTLGEAPRAPAGYVAFANAALFFIGLALLPGAPLVGATRPGDASPPAPPVARPSPDATV